MDLAREWEWGGVGWGGADSKMSPRMRGPVRLVLAGGWGLRAGAGAGEEEGEGEGGELGGGGGRGKGWSDRGRVTAER